MQRFSENPAPKREVASIGKTFEKTFMSPQRKRGGWKSKNVFGDKRKGGVGC